MINLLRNWGCVALLVVGMVSVYGQEPFDADNLPTQPLGMEREPRVAAVTDSSNPQVVACADVIYAVSDAQLIGKVGPLRPPTTTPAYSEGRESLQAFFAKNPLADERVREFIFKVRIGFLVTCNGQAGNYMVVTPDRNKMMTYDNQVLDIVKTMPQKWTAATRYGNAVDCYQVISFDILDGKLTRMGYNE